MKFCRFIVEPYSGGVFPFLGSCAVFPAAQTGICTLVVLHSEREGFAVDKLLPAFVDTRCCFHKQRTAMGISNLRCAMARSEMVNDTVNQDIRRSCKSWYKSIEEGWYAKYKEEDNKDRPRTREGRVWADKSVHLAFGHCLLLLWCLSKKFLLFQYDCLSVEVRGSDCLKVVGRKCRQVVRLSCRSSLGSGWMMGRVS